MSPMALLTSRLTHTSFNSRKSADSGEKVAGDVTPFLGGGCRQSATAEAGIRRLGTTAEVGRKETGNERAALSRKGGKQKEELKGNRYKYQTTLVSAAATFRPPCRGGGFDEKGLHLATCLTIRLQIGPEEDHHNVFSTSASYTCRDAHRPVRPPCRCATKAGASSKRPRQKGLSLAKWPANECTCLPARSHKERNPTARDLVRSAGLAACVFHSVPQLACRL